MKKKSLLKAAAAGKTAVVSLVMIMVLSHSYPAFGQTVDEKIARLEEMVRTLQEEISELKAEHESVLETQGGLAEEIRNVKLEAAAPEAEYQSYAGMGPAASKVYFSPMGLSIGGYGHVDYNMKKSGADDTADAYRFILYAGYKFTDRIIMNTELEFEHAGISNVAARAAEAYTEFSYLDFLIKPSFNVRAGLILTPIGLINEYHEPTLFNSVNRPEVETNIIPSTWRDIGLMFHGRIGENLNYKYARMIGQRADLFSGKDWIRGGRQLGAKSEAGDFADVLNLEYSGISNLRLGATNYNGGAGQSDSVKLNDGSTAYLDGDVNLWELHADYRRGGLEVKGLYAAGSLSGNQDFETRMAEKGVGKKVNGWYLELAYDVSKNNRASVLPFIRHSRYDLNASVFPGDTADDSYDRTVTTIGLHYKPHPNVSVKFDYEMKNSDAASATDASKIDQYNLGVGFLF